MYISTILSWSAPQLSAQIVASTSCCVIQYLHCLLPYVLIAFLKISCSFLISSSVGNMVGLLSSLMLMLQFFLQLQNTGIHFVQFACVTLASISFSIAFIQASAEIKLVT